MSCKRRTPAAAVALAIWAAAAAPAPALASDDPYFERQWNLTQVGAPAAWAQSTGAGVTIGIVDTGVDATHPDLAGKIDAMATCLGGPCREGSAPDGDGHGTSVAAVAAAKAGNGVGIAGVAPEAHLVVAKALDDDGTGRTEDINNAIQWVVDHGARIVNLSLGGSDLTVVSRLGTPLKSAIEYAWSRGAIPVLAAGNYDDDITQAGSANYGTLDAVVVGATDAGGAISSYSTSLGNAKWGIVAPGGSGKGTGVDVITAVPGGRYAWEAGTSFAAPHVSGTLALLLAQGLEPSAAVARLLATSDRTVACGSGCQGRLRADLAVAPPSTPPVTVTAPPATASPIVRTPQASKTTDQLNPAIVAVAIVLLLAAWGATCQIWRWERARRPARPGPLDDIFADIALGRERAA